MKTVYATQEEVPEGIRDEYSQAEDGTFVLKLDGDHPVVTAVVAEANKKVGEFRNTNITSAKALAEAQAKLDALKGVTVEGYAEAQARVTELEGKQKGMKGQDDIKALIDAALEPVTAALATERTARETAQREAATQKMDGTLTAAGLKAGVVEGAISDFLSRGREAFRLVDGKLEAQKDGAPVYSTKRPGEILSVDEWASDLQAEAPHLYKDSTGGGAGGGGNAHGDDTRTTIPRDQMKHNLEAVAKGEKTVGQ